MELSPNFPRLIVMFFELHDLTINNLKIVEGPGKIRDMKKILLPYLEKPAKIIKQCPNECS